MFVLSARSLIYHQRGHTSHPQYIMINAPSHKNSPAVRLSLFKSMCMTAVVREICRVSFERSHTSRQRFNYTVSNKDPAQHTWRFNGCGENTESMGVATLYSGSNYGIIVCNVCLGVLWKSSSWVMWCLGNPPSPPAYTLLRACSAKMWLMLCVWGCRDLQTPVKVCCGHFNPLVPVWTGMDLVPDTPPAGLRFGSWLLAWINTNYNKSWFTDGLKWMNVYYPGY